MVRMAMCMTVCRSSSVTMLMGMPVIVVVFISVVAFVGVGMCMSNTSMMTVDMRVLFIGNFPIRISSCNEVVDRLRSLGIPTVCSYSRMVIVIMQAVSTRNGT